MKTKMIKGTCLCEEVAYQISGALGPVYNCHCLKCRRWHGAAFRTRASIKKSQFIWLSGENNVAEFKFSANVTKHFCSNCGSPLVTTYKDNPDIYGVALGPLEGKIKNHIEGHIFVGSKANWYEITDNQPCFEEWPGKESKVRETK